MTDWSDCHDPCTLVTLRSPRQTAALCFKITKHKTRCCCCRLPQCRVLDVLGSTHNLHAMHPHHKICVEYVKATHHTQSWQFRKAAWMEQGTLLQMTFHTHGQPRTSPLDDHGTTGPAQRTHTQHPCCYFGDCRTLMDARCELSARATGTYDTATASRRQCALHTLGRRLDWQLA